VQEGGSPSYVEMAGTFALAIGALVSLSAFCLLLPWLKLVVSDLVSLILSKADQLSEKINSDRGG
jgi:hypothetical protein